MALGVGAKGLDRRCSFFIILLLPMISINNVEEEKHQAGGLPLVMEGQPLHKDPSPLQASKSRVLQNPLPRSPPFSAHLLHRSLQAPFSEPRETLPLSFTAPQYPSAVLPVCKDLLESSHLVKVHRELRESNEERQHHKEASQEEDEEEGGKNNGDDLQHRVSCSISGKINKSQAYGKMQVSAARTCESLRNEKPSIGRTLESPRASIPVGSPEASVDEDGMDPADDSSHTRSGSLHGESGYEKESSNDSSGGKDMANDLSLHEGVKGQVSPLRALSHIAHIKRRQDCLQANSGHMQAWAHPDGTMEFPADFLHGSTSKKKKFKQVQFQLETLTYQKLSRLLVEQHQGSFQRFVMATLDSVVMQDKSEKKSTTIARKPSFSKWKRTRFEQLKGTETQELASAFKSLADSTPGVELASDLMHTPWQELNMLQIQKMLEETKKMLLVNEKVHDCPYADCGRRFSTPGNLKDHLNEHSGEQPYSCSFEDCPHRFRSKQHLCRHIKKHERAHTCTFEGCNKRFAFRERLIVHQKIHSDERPLACPWEGCGKTFKWANSLHGHMRTHTGEKPFQCTFAGCGRLFGYKVDLTRHRRTHFGQPARASH